MHKTPSSMTIVEVPIDDLRPDPANPRRISEAELEALTRSIHEWGFVQPVLARQEDRTVIGGHQRLVAARRLGHKRSRPGCPRPAPLPEARSARRPNRGTGPARLVPRLAPGQRHDVPSRPGGSSGDHVTQCRTLRNASGATDRWRTPRGNREGGSKVYKSCPRERCGTATRIFAKYGRGEGS